MALGPVTLAVRPEDVIAPAEAAPAEEDVGGNLIKGRLESFEFLGYFVRAALIVEGLEKPVYVDLSHNRIRRLGMKEGQEAMAALPGKRLRIYPAAS